MPEELFNPSAGKDAYDYLGVTIRALTEAVTGIASSDNKDLALSIGYILQRVRGGHFLQQLSEEFKKYRDIGRIKQDYASTEQGMTCLQQILDCVDKDSPDQTRFNAMKDLFLGAAFEKLSTRDDILPAQLMRICRALSSAELLLLLANYRLANQDIWKQQAGSAFSGGITRNWVVECRTESGLRFEELVLEAEATLQEKRLLGVSQHGDRSGFVYTNHYRLTDLGYKLCEFIHAPDSEKT
jgi:hypothetical protein